MCEGGPPPRPSRHADWKPPADQSLREAWSELALEPTIVRSSRGWHRVKPVSVLELNPEQFAARARAKRGRWRDFMTKSVAEACRSRHPCQVFNRSRYQRITW